MVKHKKIIIYTDGGSRGNPGASAIGIVMFDINKNEIFRHSECIGEGTNNQAEYKALIIALDLATAHCRKEVVCFLDSELVVRQLNSTYAIKNKELKKLFDILKIKERAFDSVLYNHTKRTNKFIQRADLLVNKALDDF